MEAAVTLPVAIAAGPAEVAAWLAAHAYELAATTRTHGEWATDYDAVKNMTGAPGYVDKVLHPVLVDAGPSNFKLKTAIDLIIEHADDYPDLGLEIYLNDYASLAEDLTYIGTSGELTAKLYGLYMKVEAEPFFMEHGAYGMQWNDLPQEFRDALLVTYTNRGLESMEKTLKTPYEPLPGLTDSGGISHLSNSAAIGTALGLAAYGTDVVAVDNFDTQAMESGAEALAYRYALVNLRYVALPGLDYDANALSLYDPETGSGEFSEAWLHDRAELLQWNVQAILQGINYPDELDADIDGDWDWIDYTMLDANNDPLRISIDGNGLYTEPNHHRVVFGGSGDETIDGGSRADRLYGSAGDDTLTGNGGGDYLEGGEGFDTYYAGEGYDIIFDADAQGKVYFGSTLLDGGANVSGGWLSRDDKFTYTMVGNDLLVQSSGSATGAVYIKDFENGDLGILLGNRLTTDPARVERVFGSSGNDIINTLDEEDVIIPGNGNDIVHAGTGNDIVWGDGGNDILYGEQGLDYLDGDPGNDLIYGGSGADLIDGNAGNDILYADNGPEDLAQAAASGQGDWLNGGAGDDELNGSARADFLAGGAGKDVLRGGAGDDVLTGDGDYRPFYPFDYYEVVDLTGLQMQIELGALLATLAGMPGLLLEAQYILGQLQTGETFLPPLGSGRVGADWTCHAPTAAYPRGYWERTAPTYQLSPKPGAHAWTVSFDEDGGFTLVSQVVRDASQFVVAAENGAADTLEGGKGNDALYGGAGDDVYHFNLGDGEDRVYDSLAEGDNILRFGENIGRDDLQLVEDAAGLTLLYGGQGDSICLPGADRDDAVFRTVELADGTRFDFAELFVGNRAPEVAASLPGQAGKQGEAFTLVLPEGLFTDADGDALAYSVTRADGGALPAWLAFDPVTRTLSGTPGEGDAGDFALKITSTDPGGLFASLVFDLEIEAAPLHNPVVGTSGNDTLPGTAGDDHFQGLAGNDTLRAGAGDDILDGGEGNDTFYAGIGDDVLVGGAGNDKLYGEAGNDSYRGGEGNDTLYDSAGNETYHFALGDGADTLLDTQGDDTLIFENIDYTQLWFQRTGPNDRNLEISVLGTDDKVTVTDWFLSGNSSRQIEHIQAGEYELDAAEVAGLVEALVACAAQPDSGIGAPSLAGIAGNYWDVV